MRALAAQHLDLDAATNPADIATASAAIPNAAFEMQDQAVGGARAGCGVGDGAATAPALSPGCWGRVTWSSQPELTVQGQLQASSWGSSAQPGVGLRTEAPLSAVSERGQQFQSPVALGKPLGTRVEGVATIVLHPLGKPLGTRVEGVVLHPSRVCEPVCGSSRCMRLVQGLHACNAGARQQHKEDI